MFPIDWLNSFSFTLWPQRALKPPATHCFTHTNKHSNLEATKCNHSLVHWHWAASFERVERKCLGQYSTARANFLSQAHFSTSEPAMHIHIFNEGVAETWTSDNVGNAAATDSYLGGRRIVFFFFQSKTFSNLKLKRNNIQLDRLFSTRHSAHTFL